jgi:hypothetical protein
MQVSPIEIENTLLAHPAKLITDASVAGVSGGRTSDERIPRAWVVLSSTGAALGDKEVVAQLVGWVEEQLSRYKWLRGGIGIVEAASVFFYSLVLWVGVLIALLDRFRSHRLGKC